MIGMIEAKDIQQLRTRDLKINDRIFVLALNVVQRSPLIVRIDTTRAGLPLYALPGGGRATERDIRNMIRGGK